MRVFVIVTIGMILRNAFVWIPHYNELLHSWRRPSRSTAAVGILVAFQQRNWWFGYMAILLGRIYQHWQVMHRWWSRNHALLQNTKWSQRLEWELFREVRYSTWQSSPSLCPALAYSSCSPTLCLSKLDTWKIYWLASILLDSSQLSEYIQYNNRYQKHQNSGKRCAQTPLVNIWQNTTLTGLRPSTSSTIEAWNVDTFDVVILTGLQIDRRAGLSWPLVAS